MTPQRGPVARFHGAFWLLALVAMSIPAPPAEARDRVIVLGFDGADASITDSLMNEGRLPNLARLRDAGTFLPLAPTNPPQTPVSWATFSTGLDPGSTEIFDFLKRIPGTYYPDFAVAEESREPFLWGRRNPLLTGMLGFVAGYVLLFLVVAIVRGRGARLALVPLALALPIAAAGFWFGSAFLPHEVPKAINNRKGITYWDWADQHNIRTRTIRVPTSFPTSEPEHGDFLSGLGVPDIRGRIGTPSSYTSERFEPGQYDDFSVEVVSIPRRGHAEVEIFGPRNLPFYHYRLDEVEAEARRGGKDPKLARQIAEDRLRRRGVPKNVTIPLVLDIADDAVRIQTSGHDLTLSLGEWSPWLKLTFPMNRFMKIHGIGRFKLESLDPEVRLYFSPVHLDPSDLPPIAKLCHPRDFTERLVEEIGLFKTMGWSIDTWSLEEERITESTFLEDVGETIRHFGAMFDRFIEDENVELYTQIFYFTDRVQHMMWRLRDLEHPRYDAEKAALYAHSIPDSYEMMDRIVGKALTKVNEQTHLIVVSDHGFVTWRRSVNLNTWLARNGFMTLTGEGAEKDLEALFDKGSFWPNVDWSRTKAFALGLGYVYLNVLGREPEGVVLPGDEYDRVCQAIARGLESLVDPATGLHPVSKVYRRDEIYRTGFDPDLIPDLRVCNTPGYRVSWQSSLGNTPKEILYDNDKNWSADHCSVDPAFVDGILLTSFPLSRDDAWIGDIFPTICDLMDLDTPDGLHGRSLVGSETAALSGSGEP